ncbi:MAG: NAD(P)H-binding protein, partial [Gemmatimonadaceae bacterium]
VGRWATRRAATAGHNVTALVRPSTPFEAPVGVVVRRGSALEPDFLSEAIQGQDAVISCIGSQRTNPRNPWSPLRQPLHAAELTARALVTAMTGDSGRRVVAISAGGVGDGIEAANAMIRWMTRHTTIGAMYADLDAMEQVLRASSVDWLAVRAVTLINAAPSNRTKVLRRYRLHSVVGRADVAAWMVQSLVDPRPISDRTPLIGWW